MEIFLSKQYLQPDNRCVLVCVMRHTGEVAMDIYGSADCEKRIMAEQSIMRSGAVANVNLCQYGNLSCVRCCLAHIGGDSPIYIGDDVSDTDDSSARRAAGCAEDDTDRYLGPSGIVMKFRNFNPRKGPRMEASQYEDSFPDVGREEMERRFATRRALFLNLYDRSHPEQTLRKYMQAAWKNEGYRYRHEADAGPFSMYIGGTISTRQLQSGELPECHLLGFLDDEKTRVGCMAHHLTAMSQGYDGRDRVGFFHNSGCCEGVGCEASREFRYLSAAARKIFNRAVEGMSWYEYSRHATSVLVYYLRGYECVIQLLKDVARADIFTLPQLAEFTNDLYDNWPLRNHAKIADYDANSRSDRMASLEILSSDIPLTERIFHIAIGSELCRDSFVAQLNEARVFIEQRIVSFEE